MIYDIRKVNPSFLRLTEKSQPFLGCRGKAPSQPFLDSWGEAFAPAPVNKFSEQKLSARLSGRSERVRAPCAPT